MSALNPVTANRLAALRQKSGLSQEQLADKLGVSCEAISNWENAASDPDAGHLIEMANLYRVSLDDLLMDEPDAAEDAALASETDEAEEEQPGKTEGGSMWQCQGSDGRIDWKTFPYPVVVTLVYLLIGFLFGLWHPGWLLFLTIPLYYTAISPKGGFDLNRIPYPLLVSILYVVAGFAIRFWHPGWLIFLTIPLYYTLAGQVIREKANRILTELLLIGVVYLIGTSLGHMFQLWLAIPALAFIVIVAIRERAIRAPGKTRPE